MKNINKPSIRITYMIGLPAGLTLMLLVFLFLINADESILEFIQENMGYSSIALVIGFII